MFSDCLYYCGAVELQDVSSLIRVEVSSDEHRNAIGSTVCEWFYIKTPIGCSLTTSPTTWVLSIYST